MKSIIIAALLLFGAVLIALMIRKLAEMILERFKPQGMSFCEFKTFIDGIIKENDPRILMSPMVATSIVAISIFLCESAARRERIWRKFEHDFAFSKVQIEHIERLRAEIKEGEKSDEQH